MTSFNDKTGRKRVLCCRNCRKLYRDEKGKYRCSKTRGEVLPNSICEECTDASIAVTIEDLLLKVNAKYYRKIYRRKHDS